MYNFYVKITRNNKVILATIKYDQAIIIDSILYTPNNTIEINDVENNLDLIDIIFNVLIVVSTTQVDNILCGDLITIGLYNHVKQEKYTIKSGFISEISRDNTKISITAQNKLDFLNIKIGLQYSTTCNNCFADKNCSLDKYNYIITDLPILKVNGNQLEIDNQIWQAKVAQFSQDFLDKTIANSIILNQDDLFLGKIYAKEANILSIFPLYNNYYLNQGEKINLLLQCDKTFSTCNKYFKNKNNFNGQPLLDKN
jgi:uncharacterized phage protein (TIGR02218 family)